MAALRLVSICSSAACVATLGLATSAFAEGGEDIGSAVVINSLPYADTGDTCDNVDDYDEICPFNTPGAPDVVYAYTPAEDQSIIIDLCESGFDTKVYVYDIMDPAYQGGVFVACNDDACNDSQGNPFRSLVTANLVGGTTYYIVVDAYGSSTCGFYDLVIEPAPVVECPPEGILEGEPDCADEYVDEWNGGCNSVDPVFQDIACGDIICAKSGTYLFGGSNYRDTDWFRYVSDELTIYNWSAVANFPLLIFIIQGPCPGGILLSASVPAFTPASLTSSCLPPGEYYFWAGPSVFTGAPCDTSEYIAEFTCEPCFIPIGACCLPDGSCLDDQLEEDCAALFGEFQGDGTICAETVCVPCVECEDTEGEPICGDNYVDEWNGGCNSSPAVFQDIVCGQQICAGSGTYLFDGLNYRDTDWFRLVAEEPYIYTWTATGNFPLLIFIIQGPCPGGILTSASVPPCQEASITFECLAPGEYYFWAGPSVFSGVPCDSAQYVAELTCEPCMIPTGACCLADGCVDDTFEDECFNVLFGTAWFEGQLCADVTCPIVPENDACPGAIALEVPADVFGDTTLATIDVAPFCGTSITAPGIWYSVMGTGGPLVATTCTDFFDYDTKLSVYTDGCGILTCVGGNDDNCSGGASGLLSTVQWDSVDGQEYLILVHGFSSGVGEFNLLVFGLGAGACCLPNGDCIETDQGNCAALGGEFQGDETTCDEVVCEPCVVCPEGSIPENEPVCEDEYVDMWNGGCNSDPAVFQAINCNTTICGESGTYLFTGLNYRDTDWFEYLSAGDQNVSWDVEATFSLLIFIIDGNAGCDGLTIINSTTAAPCSPASLSAPITAGTYWFWVGPSIFSGIPCPSVYVATLSSDSCCIGDVDGDGDVDVDDLLDLLAAWGTNDPAADLDGSGEVNVSDLLILLADWGCTT